MPRNGRGAKNKGSEYERTLATYFNDNLFDGSKRCTRAPLSGGGVVNSQAGGTDLLGLPGLFVEAKRTERLNIRAALKQAEDNCAKRRETNEVPVTITRRNRESTGQSLVTLRLDHFLSLYAAWLRERGEV